MDIQADSSPRLTLADVANHPGSFTRQMTLSSGEAVTFRPLASNDVDALARFLAGLSQTTRRLSTFAGYDNEAARELCDAINRFDKLRFVLVADASDEIIGLMEFSFSLPDADRERYEGYGLQLLEASDCRFGPTLADDYQDKGLGSQVFPLIADVARRFGKTRMMLWGGVVEDNARAIRYYEKQGFKHVGHYVRPDGDAIADMILDLTSS